MYLKLICIVIILSVVFLTGCYNHTVIPKEQAYLSNIEDDIIVVLNDAAKYEIMHDEYYIENLRKFGVPSVHREVLWYLNWGLTELERSCIQGLHF